MERDVHLGSCGRIVARAVTSSVGVIGCSIRLNLAVGVSAEIGHRGAGRSVHHVIDQVFLVRKAIDAVLVFDRASQICNRDTVDAVAVIVSHGVVHIVGTPTTPGAGDKNICEPFWGTGHVHVKRRLALGRKREQRSQKHKRITHKNELKLMGWQTQGVSTKRFI